MFANRLKKNLDKLAAWARARAGFLLSHVRRRHARVRVRDRSLPVGSGGHARAAGSTCRNTRRPRRSTATKATRAARGSDLRAAGGHGPRRPTRSTGARAGRRRASRSTRRSPTSTSAWSWRRAGSSSSSTSPTTSTPGLFLDHRPTRARIRELAKGKRFLNLFCYTGAATVYAAAGGAAATTSVDMSRTYLDWAKRNLVDQRARAASTRSSRRTASPGSPSGSGGALRPHLPRPADLLELEAHGPRVRRAARPRRPHPRDAEARSRRAGCCSSRRTSASSSSTRRRLTDLAIRDITKGTVPFDFARDAKVHACFEIRQALGELLDGLDRDRGQALAALAHVDGGSPRACGAPRTSSCGRRPARPRRPGRDPSRRSSRCRWPSRPGAGRSSRPRSLSRRAPTRPCGRLRIARHALAPGVRLRDLRDLDGRHLVLGAVGRPVGVLGRHDVGARIPGSGTSCRRRPAATRSVTIARSTISPARLVTPTQVAVA